MRNVSNKFTEAMQTRRDFYPVAQIAFANGTEKTLEKGDFTVSGNSVTESAESSSFPLGILAAKRITISLMNDDDRWSEYDFYGAKIRLYTDFQLDEVDPFASENLFGFNKNVAVSIGTATLDRSINGIQITKDGGGTPTTGRGGICRLSNLGFGGIRGFYTVSGEIYSNKNIQIAIEIDDTTGKIYDVTTSPQKFVVQCDVTSKMDAYATSFSGLFTNGFIDFEGTVSDGTIVYVKNLKVEYGKIDEPVWSIAPEDVRIERLNIGEFTVITPENYGTTISITAMDDSYKTDIDYSTGLSYPISAVEALRDSCRTCGITLQTSTFPNNNYSIPTMPESLTHRQFIGMIAMIAGGNAIFNENNRLVVKPYDFTAFEKSGDEWGGIFDNLSDSKYMTGDDVSGGVFEPWDVGEVDDPLFSDLDDIHFLHDFKSGITVESDDVVITGVQIVDDDKNVHLYGSEGYILSLENQLATGKEDEVVRLIGQAIVGLRFRPFSGDHIAYPLAEFMDLAYLIDRVGRAYRTVLTDVDFGYYGFTNLKCAADSPIRNSSTYYGNETKAIVQARKLVEQEKTDRERAVESLATQLAQSGGLFMTTEPQPDGSFIYYMHNKPSLEESMIVWKLTANAFAISTDGGKSYPYGLDATGMAILDRIYAIGINADYITSGTLVLGGEDNKYGTLKVYSTGGNLACEMDFSGVTSYNGIKLYENPDDLFSTTAFNIHIDYNLLSFGRGSYNCDFRNYQKVHHYLYGDIGYGFCEDIENELLSLNAQIVLRPPGVNINSINGINDITEGLIFLDNSRFFRSINLNNGVHIYFADGQYLNNGVYNNSNAIYAVGGFYVRGDFGCSGTKKRVVETQNYGNIGMSAFETSSPYFSDIGSGTVGDNGEITIFFDPVFAETIDMDSEYQVFLTRTSKKVTEWVEKQYGYFIVHGEPGATFDWMICAPQLGYNSSRLECINIESNEDIAFEDYIFETDDLAINILNEINEKYEKEIELL